MFLTRLRKHPYWLISAFFMSISFFYVYIVFNNIPRDSFLLAHDHAAWISSEQLIDQSFILSKTNSGLCLPVQLVTSFTGRVLYSTFYSLGLGIRSTQFIVSVLFLYLLQAVPFLGIKKMCKILGGNIDIVDNLLVSFFYSFSPLIVIFMSTGNFWNLNFLISYSTLPLLFSYAYIFFESKRPDLVDLVILAVSLYISSLYIPFIVSISFILFSSVVINFELKDILNSGLKKYIILLFLFLLMFSTVIFSYFISVVESYRGAISDALIDSTAGSLRGGILTMMLNRFSWVIYTIWKPRSIIPFYEYYDSVLFLLASLLIYAILIFYSFKIQKLGKFFCSIHLILLISLFFAKGPQGPFGLIYNFLINNVPLFQVIRSPDNKLSLGVVFSLALISLVIFSRLMGVPKLLFRIYLIFAILVFAWPFLTGEAILGENIQGQSGDFITKIYPEHKEAARVINLQPGHFGVLLYPPTTLPVTLEKGGNLFIGKDTLGSLLNYPVYYLSVGALTEPYVQNILADIYNEFSIEKLNQLSIGYILIRKDMYDKKWISRASEVRMLMDNTAGFSKIVENEMVEVYKVPYSLAKPTMSMYCDGGGEFSYKYISPIRYDISISDIDSICQIEFMGLHSDSWRFFVLPKSRKIGLLHLPIPLNLEKISKHYPNEWVIGPNKLNNLPVEYVDGRDGVDEWELVLYYIPQLYYYVFQFISLIALFICLVYVISKRKKSILISPFVD